MTSAPARAHAKAPSIRQRLLCARNRAASHAERRVREELPRSLPYTLRSCVCPFLFLYRTAVLTLFFPSHDGVVPPRAAASFRPSLPKKRRGIHLIDRFTVPEDILLLRYTRHVFPFFVAWFPSLPTRDPPPPTLPLNLEIEG